MSNTKVELLIPGKGAIRPQGVETILDELEIDHAVIAQLDSVFSTGKGSMKVDPSQVDGIMKWVSREDAGTRYVVRMKGEDEAAASTREYVDGVAAVSTYKPAAPTKPSKAARAAIAAIGDAPPYAATTTYAVGEALDHPKFGKGVVSQAQGGKIVVQFADAERTLVHARS